MRTEKAVNPTTWYMLMAETAWQSFLEQPGSETEGGVAGPDEECGEEDDA